MSPWILRGGGHRPKLGSLSWLPSLQGRTDRQTGGPHIRKVQSQKESQKSPWLTPTTVCHRALGHTDQSSRQPLTPPTPLLQDTQRTALGLVGWGGSGKGVARLGGGAWNRPPGLHWVGGGRSEKTPHNQKLLARAHKTLKTEWWTDNESVTHPNKGMLLVGLGPNYWYKERLGGTSKTWCEVREASLQRWPTVWLYLYDIWGRRNWGSGDPVRSPLGEMESDCVLDCGGHRNLMCTKIHRPMLDTERKKRQCLLW